MTGRGRKLTDLVTREEIRALLRASDLRGALSVALDWGIIGAAMALVAWRPGVVTVLAALVVIGGRQLGLAVLMHECSHRSLFARAGLNEWVGRWLCAAPMWNHLEKYRAHHLRHHSHAGTERDPDRSLITPFPVRRASLARKLLRDVSGVSGVKRVIGLLMMDLGLLRYTASADAVRVSPEERSGSMLRTGARSLGPVLLAQCALLGVLWLVGYPALYTLWVGAWLTTFGLFLRIRSIAEHAGTAESADPFLNTRTTVAGALARLTVAPHHVNYHLEHHLLMTAPHYRLPELHRLLRDRGGLDGSPLARGYGQVLRTVAI